MTPVDCMVKHDPENGTYGDCLRACVASVLDLPADAVPHFNHDCPDGETSHRRLSEFLASHKLSPFVFAVDGDLSPDNARKEVEAYNSNIHYLMFGETVNGGHVIVCKGADIVHNPSWTNEPLIKPPVGDGWAMMLFASLL